MEHKLYADPNAETLIKTHEAHEMERIRNDYVNHESSVKGIGWCVALVSGFLLLMHMVHFVEIFHKFERFDMSSIGVTLLFFLLEITLFVVGLGLYRLIPVARISGAILSGVAMFYIPLGTIIGGYILYTLMCKKGKYVFTPDYQQIRAATPHVKLRSSLASMVLFGYLIILLFLVVSYAISSNA